MEYNKKTLKNSINKAKTRGNVLTIGITNQRETTVCGIKNW